MNKFFTKDQLKEMVKEREEWLREVGGNYNETAVHRSVVFNCMYHPNKANRFIKKQLVEAITILDEARYSILAIGV